MRTPSLLTPRGSGHRRSFSVVSRQRVLINCHSSNPAAVALQHHPNEDDPFYLKVVRESQRWGTPDQLLLEVGTSDPAILAQVRQAAPERFVMLRSLWGEEGNLQRLMASGLNLAGDGLLLPSPKTS